MAALDQARIQTVASTYGADWSKWITILQKLSGPLQEMITILLEQNNKVPMIAQSGGQFDIDMSEVQPVAAMYGIDYNELMSLLQVVQPMIARLILAFLNSNNLKTA